MGKRTPSDPLGRILARIEINESGCWIWPGSTTKGYGDIHADGRTVATHRLVYERLVGPIPDGLVVDHQCHNADPRCHGAECAHRRCCNPDHLEVVTQLLNTQRGRGPHGATHCKAGHEYTEENTRIRVMDNGRTSRRCRACSRVHERRSQAKRRSA